MKHRLPALLMAVFLTLALASCGAQVSPGTDAPDGVPVTDLKVGLVLLGDKTDAYNQSHITELMEACRALGMTFSSQVLIRDGVIEDETCIAAVNELADQGCHVVFTTSYGHEPYMQAASDSHPRTQFCQAAGVRSASDNRKNTHAYFVGIHEARYLSGIAAGLATETDMLGYVAGKNIDEVISSFTAFYLGARSVNPNAVMMVSFTNNWSNPDLESRCTQALIDQGCDVIAHHTSTAAPVLTAEENGVLAVGYSQDMVAEAPHAALTSVQVNWSEYYEYALDCLISGRTIDQDWLIDYSQGGCSLTPLNTPLLPDGVQTIIDRAAQGFTEGSRQVFAGPLRGVNENREPLDLREGQFYEECKDSSAPSFDYIVDGITLLP